MTEPLHVPAEPPAGLNILVVDDSAMMRSMIKRATNLTGLRIRHIYEASNGSEALDVLERQHVDAILTDINMPGMTGIELLRRIAADERWRNVVRVVITSDGSEARRSEAERLDVHLYVGKPFRPEVIRDVLADLTTAL